MSVRSLLIEQLLNALKSATGFGQSTGDQVADSFKSTTGLGQTNTEKVAQGASEEAGGVSLLLASNVTL